MSPVLESRYNEVWDRDSRLAQQQQQYEHFPLVGSRGSWPCRQIFQFNSCSTIHLIVRCILRPFYCWSLEYVQLIGKCREKSTSHFIRYICSTFTLSQGSNFSVFVGSFKKVIILLYLIIKDKVQYSSRTFWCFGPLRWAKHYKSTDHKLKEHIDICDRLHLWPN